MEIKKYDTTGIKYNLLIYFLFMLIAAIGIFYGNAIRGSYTFLRVWDYQNLLIMLLGIPFLFLQSKSNLPNFWDLSVSIRKRLIEPVCIGAIFGILDILVIKVMLHPEPYTELPPFLQPFPYSIFLFFSGAFEIEVFYRLIPLTLILLLGKWYAFPFLFFGICKSRYLGIFLFMGEVYAPDS
jgi:hypothetical protein